MSWLKSAVNKAVEVGGRNTLTRTVRNYADSVVLHAGQAVAGGARIIQDRFAGRSLVSFRHTVKRLEEVSVSCRGEERIQLLRRWLVALKETERLFPSFDNNEKDSSQYHSSDESKDSPRKPVLVLYYDTDFILEAPSEEEASLLLEIFGLCLTGGKEVHNAILSSIKDLAKVSSTYQDEVLVKREELLQYAQGAIAGLKINADLIRIDVEASSLQKKLDEYKALQQPSSEVHENSSEKPTILTIEALKDALAQIRLCSRLEELLLKKKSIRCGDSPEIYDQKIEKLKILSESLASSTSKSENRILDHRSHKEEALSFRVAKANEVIQLEKELGAEIRALEKLRYDLEAELKKVNTALGAALARLHNAREEREQFDEASTQIVAHLKMKEDELSRAIDTYRAEGDVVNTWISFLEDTWVLQISSTQQKEKHVNDELERYGDHFVKLATGLLSAYKEELGPSITHIKKVAENLRSSEKMHSLEDENSSGKNPRKILEEKYLYSEAKLGTTFSVIDSMRKHFYAQHEDVHRKDDQSIKELFDAVDKLKNEFESIERPVLEIEIPTPRAETPSQKAPQKSSSPTPKHNATTPEYEQDGLSEILKNKGEKAFDPAERLAMLELESGKSSADFSAGDILEWEFDDLEHDFKTSNSQVKQ